MRNIYRPDKWAVFKISDGNDTVYKVLGSWSGGYLYGDSWRLNSGITRVEEDTDSFKFYGSSGSCYECGKNSYGLGLASSGIATEILNSQFYETELLEKDTSWGEIDYGTQN